MFDSDDGKGGGGDDMFFRVSHTSRIDHSLRNSETRMRLKKNEFFPVFVNRVG